MTVNELSQRLARWTSSKGVSQMSVEDRLVVLDCINAAIFDWFSAAPENMRMTSVSHFLRAPETGTVSITEGSNELSGLALQDYHLGATIDIGDGSNIMNEIVSVDGTPTVLNQLRATGTVSYTIYFDTIMLTDYLVSRIVSNPRVLDNGCELFRDDQGMKFVGAERRGSHWGSKGNWWSIGTVRNFGEPRRYVIENTGISLNDEARIMMRIDPIPLTPLTIKFDAVIDAPRLQLKDMDGAVTIPVPDQYCLSHLLPLAIGNLAMNPLWDAENDRNLAIQKAQSIPQKMRSDLNQNRGLANNKVRTRPGY